MDREALRQFCLALPHTTESVQWGEHLVFKVGGKIYAILSLEPQGHFLSFKCSDEDFESLIDQVGIVPAPYLARAHWVALEHARVLRPRELEVLLAKAYSLVRDRLPRKARENLERDAGFTTRNRTKL